MPTYGFLIFVNDPFQSGHQTGVDERMDDLPVRRGADDGDHVRFASNDFSRNEKPAQIFVCAGFRKRFISLGDFALAPCTDAESTCRHYSEKSDCGWLRNTRKDRTT